MKNVAMKNMVKRRVIAEILVGAAIALGSGVGGAAPASADPDPFSTLSCSCQETAPAGSPALRDEINRGIAEGHSASVPGLPPPTRPRQSRP